MDQKYNDFLFNKNQFQCYSKSSLNKDECNYFLCKSYNIQAVNNQTVSLEDKNIFTQIDNTTDIIYYITLKSSDSLVISTFVKYSCLSNKITIKCLFIFAYEILIEESELITLSFPNVTLSSKQFNIANLFSFAIHRISKSSHILFIVSFNLIFIITIEERNNKLVHKIIYKGKLKGNRFVYLGYQDQKSEINFYILSKPNNLLIQFKCVNEQVSNLIEIIKYENNIPDCPIKLKRFTQSTGEFNLFLEKNSNNGIILNKNTIEIFELHWNECQFGLNSMILFNNNNKRYLLQDKATNDSVSISQYSLVFDEKRKQCDLSLFEVYVITFINYEKHLFSMLNEECFCVNFYSHFLLYYLNKSNDKFEFVHNFNIGSICYLARSFNLNTFSIHEKQYIILETFKEHNLVFFKFQIEKTELYSCCLTQMPIIIDVNKKKEFENLNDNVQIKENQLLQKHNTKVRNNRSDQKYLNEDNNMNRQEPKRTIKIIQRKDNYFNLFSSPLSSNINIKKNINMIDNNYLDNIKNNETDSYINEKEKQKKVVQETIEEMDKHINNQNRKEQNIDLIMINFIIKFNRLNDRIKNCKEKYNNNMLNTGTIFQQILSQVKNKEPINILKCNEIQLVNKKEKKKLMIENCINENLISSRSSLFANIVSPLNGKQQKPTNHYPQFNIYPQNHEMLQDNYHSHYLNTLDENNNVNNTMITNWQQLLNKSQRNLQQQINNMNFFQNITNHQNVNCNYNNGNLIYHIKKQYLYEIAIQKRLILKGKAKNIYTTTSPIQFTIV